MTRPTSSYDVTSPAKLNFDTLLELNDFIVKFSLSTEDNPHSFPKVLEEFSSRNITPHFIRSQKSENDRQSISIHVSKINNKVSQEILEKLHAQSHVLYANAEILLPKRLNII